MYRITKKYLPYMIDQNYGSIVNMSSVASSLAGVVNRFSYSSSKAAIIGMTKSIAKDFVGSGIRCNAIAPATVESPSLQDRINAEDDPIQAKKDFIARQPMGRLGQPEEIANLALYLASDDSKYTTGVAHIIDGGMII
jgi:2-keto-3-deoxy-L-fuconate dehydrogenase